MKWSLFWLIWAWSAAALAAEPGFRFAKAVAAPARKQDDLLSIALDAEVYAATRHGLADIRLIDAQDHPVPYLLRRAQATSPRPTRTTWRGRQLSARPVAGGGLEITVQRDAKDPRPNGLRLVSPLRDFEKQARVFASADGANWVAVGDEATLFDYSRYADVRNDDIAFPEQEGPWFRVVLQNVTDEQQSELMGLARRLRDNAETERIEFQEINRRPFRVEAVDLWREVEHDRSVGETKSKYPAAGFRVEHDAAQKKTLVYVDLQREPLTALTLQTSDRNFSRKASVEVEQTRGALHTWQAIGEGALIRLDFQRLKREQLAISFPETRSRQCRVVIDDRDSPPLNISGILAEGNVYEVIFVAVPGAQYQLLYGSEDASPPQFDTSVIEGLLGERFHPTAAGLGLALPLQPARASGLSAKTLVNNPLLLGGIITLLMTLLGYGLYRAVQRIDNVPGNLPRD